MPLRLVALLLAMLLPLACSETNKPPLDLRHDAPVDGGASEGGGEQRLDSNGPREGGINRAPQIDDPGALIVDEDELLKLKLQVSDPDGDPLRVFANDLPPGARWHEPERELVFRPDLIQGGRDYHVTFIARDGEHEVTREVTISVRDSITPPWPRVVSTEDKGDHLRLKLAQITDSTLDSPGYAGRSIDAHVTVPKAASVQNKMPVRIDLHGFTVYPDGGGSGERFDILPHDPLNTHWWGYAENLPGGHADQGTAPNYTQRRVLHLLE